MPLSARIVNRVDLSAVIFVALALAWAGYLIPKALKHHDDLASDRLVEGHSDKVRILSRKGRAAAAAEPSAPVVVETPAPAPAPRPLATTRAAARKAAQRRRRVLGLLLVALAVVWTLTWFAYLPIWAPAIPGGMAAAWLVIARLSVRGQQRRRRVVRTTAPAVAAQASPEATPAETRLEELADEDTIGVERRELEAALADDGSLWDPLPVTLPTYVNKARARRTVRTIELTGISSSGHDESASALAREAEASAQESETAVDTTQRKVVGG